MNLEVAEPDDSPAKDLKRTKRAGRFRSFAIEAVGLAAFYVL